MSILSGTFDYIDSYTSFDSEFREFLYKPFIFDSRILYSYK